MIPEDRATRKCKKTLKLTVRRSPSAVANDRPVR